jgi:prophage antirepressor-like protein
MMASVITTSENSLATFSFGEALVRVLTAKNGDLFFVAKDIFRSLDYADASNPARLAAHVPEEWRGVKQIHTPGGTQEMHCLAEQGLYFFLARSDKPKAFPFQKWLAGEVLPAIRRTGAYSVSLCATALPDTARRLRPILRERVLSDAIAAARITGAATQEEIDAIFVRYCALISEGVGEGVVRLPGMRFAAETEVENIRRFARECLIPARGGRVHAFDLYACFMRWWQERFEAAVPSHSAFGRVMREISPKVKRGGSIIYVNVDVKAAEASV